MSARGAANALTRTTGILAAAFFITSLALGILARYSESPTDILDRIPAQTQGTGSGVLDQLGGAPAPATAPETAPAGDAAGDIPAAPAPSGSDVPSGQ
jgi:preprotein translocase subunit SecG